MNKHRDVRNEVRLKVGFVFTNYNNSRLTLQAIKSINEHKGDVVCTIVIVDNKSSSSEVEQLSMGCLQEESVICIYNDKNMGYFSGLNVGIHKLNSLSSCFDFLVVEALPMGWKDVIGVRDSHKMMWILFENCQNVVVLFIIFVFFNFCPWIWYHYYFFNRRYLFKNFR